MSQISEYHQQKIKAWPTRHLREMDSFVVPEYFREAEPRITSRLDEVQYWARQELRKRGNG